MVRVLVGTDGRGVSLDDSVVFPFSDVVFEGASLGQLHRQDIVLLEFFELAKDKL